MIETVSAAVNAAPLTPNKRNNYFYGMALGVDEFRQEQEYFKWKHRLGNRLLHGYGTVCGLRLEQRPAGDDDVEIVVGQGYAVSPQGRWIWVDRALCARLDEWLQRHREERDPFAAPGEHTVYVRLCYDECLTDLVPVAGQPCASDEESRAPSRILEAFHASLSWEKPEQLAEDYFRALSRLLRQIELVQGEGSPPAMDDSLYLLERIRHLGQEESPPAASPPEEEVIYLFAETAHETLQQAFAIWTTEVCPQLAVPEDDCILLGCIRFAVNDAGRLLAGSVELDNCDRPILLPSRLQQALFPFLPFAGFIEEMEEIESPEAPIAPDPVIPDEPESPEAEGDDEFVVAPAGYYAHIAAGSFNADGSPQTMPYNGLEANLLRENQYLLFFPDYKSPRDEVGYMVKGAVLGEPLSSAAFQVVDFSDDGIRISLTQPAMRGNRIAFESVQAAFMVEISRYKPEERLLRRRVNINAANVDELRALPRIGPTLASRIVAEREESGLFAGVNDLTRVSGIGPSVLADIRPFIFARS